MDLSSPGSDLLGTNEAAALRVLARQANEVSGREVARLATASPSSVRRALERLEHVGLVRSRISSHAVLYRANREHMLWGPVLGIMTAPARLEEVIADLVTARLGEQATVAMFGSVARRDSTADSDVDIALVFADDVAPEDRESLVDELTALVESLTGNAAQVVALSRAQLRAMVEHEDPLISSLSTDSLTLAGPSLNALIAAS